MKQKSFLILLVLFALSICSNLFFQWRITDQELAQLQEEELALFSTNYDLYEKIILNYQTKYDKLEKSNFENSKKDEEEPNLFLSRYSHCQKCLSFIRSLYNIKNKYGLKAIYENMKTVACPLLETIKIMDKVACRGFVDNYARIIFENIFSRYINSYFFCEKIDLCPVETPKKYINPDEYASKVLKDKPKIQKEKINKNGKKLRMLQITDLHLDLKFKKGASANCMRPICCRDDPTEDQIKNNDAVSGKYGFEGKCDIGQDLFKSFVEDAFQKNIDFIVWTGDNAPHDTWEGSQEEVFKISKKLKEMLDKKFRNGGKKTPVFYCLGNHEKYPNDAFHDEENNLLENMANVYQDYLDKESYETFKKYGYYTQKYDNKLRIISINCLVCDCFNFNLFNSTKVHVKSMFDWLEKVLKFAEDHKEFVYILNHFPLNGEFTLTECGKRFQALFDRYEYVIRGIFSGHTHRDDIQGITEYFNKNKVIHLNYVAPQLTTYSYKLPSYRIYTIDNETKQILNYEQFRFNLSKSNEENKPNWFLAYNATTFYNVTNMLEYNKIIKEFSNWGQYVFNQNSGSKNALKLMNNEEKIKNAKCIMRTNNFDEFFKCVHPPLGLKQEFISVISNFLIGPFEE